MPSSADVQHVMVVGPPEIGHPRLAGREQELAALRGMLAGPPAVVLLAGEAGIGKTRLLEECLAGRAGVGGRAAVGQPGSVLLVSCPPFRQPHTLGTVADALRQVAGDVARLGLSGLAGALRPLFPEWAPSLPSALEPAEDASAARHRVFCALAELLGRLRVGWLAVEDVHWADEATLEFLLHLACQKPQETGLIVTCRAEEVPAASLVWQLSRHAAGGSGLRLELGPLDVACTAALMSSMPGDQQVSGEFAAFVHEHTEGVPLAVEESVRLMGERADLTRSGTGWVRRHLADIEVPPTIRDAVLERAGRLGADARAVLQAAAVLAEPASEVTLAAVSGLLPAATQTGLCAALNCGLMDDSGPGLVMFRHVLVARAVYEAIPGPQRRALHLRAGQLLQHRSPPPLTQLARHFREAGETTQWRRYAEQAADNALATGDEATVVTLLHDLAVNAALPAAELTRLVRKIPFGSATGETRLGNLTRVLRSALDSGHLEAGQQADLRLQLGRIFIVMDHYGKARAELKRAIPHLPQDSAEVAGAMIMLGWPRGTDWPRSAHLRWLRRAGKVVVPANAAAARIRLTVDRATGLLLLGNEAGWAEAAQIPANAASPRERNEVVRGYANTADMAIVWGRYADARQRLEWGLDLAKRYHYRRYLDGMVVDTARLDWYTGAWDGLAERAAAIADSTEQRLTRLNAMLLMGLLHSAAGAHPRADECLQFVLGETLQRGMVESAMEPAAALAKLHLAANRVPEALMVTEEPMVIVAGKGTWVWATDLAPARVTALAGAGRVDEAAELVTAFARGLRGRDAPAPKAALALCRAMLAQARGEHARAAGLFAGAAAAWHALPRPYDALLAREGQARCLISTGRLQPALTLLQQVFDGLSVLGARSDAMGVAGTLRGHGVSVARPRPGRPSHGNRLSPRELEVTRLLVNGRTSQEIARELFLSPKTVASHIRSSMRKLGVATRTALAFRVVEAGLVPGRPDPGTGHSAQVSLAPGN